jgi:hypothetical protein
VVVGLDAFVYCRCWQDGLTAPPPAGPVGFDEEGYLGLLVDADGYTEDDAAVARWLAGACRHRRMELASEHVANWPGYRLFQQALAAAGWHHYPTLRAQLPNANGGRMPADAAAHALGELDAFLRDAVLDDDVVLADEDTGEAVLTYVAAYRGVVLLGPGYRAGVDPAGFFVLDPGPADPPDPANPAVTLFRSTRFRQRVLPGRLVEFSDDAGSVRVAMPPVGAARAAAGGAAGEVAGGAPPGRLRVERRRRSPADFADVVEPLRRLCRAAVATGNPVMWC